MSSGHRTPNPNRIGLMGGSFDPIHYGHLVTAEEAFCRFKLDKVVFIPTGTPAHKEKHKASAEERFRMTLLAIADNPHFEVSRVEIDRPGTSYTIDTLRYFKKDHPDDDFFFITGADAIMEILTWKDAAEVADLAHIIAATRPGYSLEKLESFSESSGFKASISILEVPALAISSTDIRKRALEGRPVRYLLPDDVSAYIYKRGFYRSK